MSEWIRSSERLPNNLSDILVLLDQRRRPYFGYFIPAANDFHVTLPDDLSDYFPIDRVKYWMPIPKLPEEMLDETVDLVERDKFIKSEIGT